MGSGEGDAYAALALPLPHECRKVVSDRPAAQVKRIENNGEKGMFLFVYLYRRLLNVNLFHREE